MYGPRGDGAYLVGDAPVDVLAAGGYPSHAHLADYHYADRATPSLPPSLWMSPSSTTPSSPSFPEHPFPPLAQIAIPGHLLSDTATGSSGSSSAYGDGRSTAPTSASSPQSTRKFPDLFSDDLFAARKASLADGSGGAPSSFPSPAMSGSPDLKAAELAAAEADPEQLAREDPLATQVWKMYAKTKATLPHGQRMENLTWRMMALALRKKKEDEEKERVKLEEGGQGPAQLLAGAAPAAAVQEEKPADAVAESSAAASTGRPPGTASSDDSERGRSKGKARVKVVGFEGTNQDGLDDNECVLLSHQMSPCTE